MAKKLSHLNGQLMGKKKDTLAKLTDHYQLLQKPAFFNGGVRKYRALAVDGVATEAEQQPEIELVRNRYQDVLAFGRALWTDLMDNILQQDVANTGAKADIVVDGKTLVKDVPATHLLFQIKQWQYVLNVISALPVPDVSVDWEYDSAAGLLKSKEDVITKRTKKIPKVLVKFDPTDKHPGQAEVYNDDVEIGEFAQRRHSGCCPVDIKRKMAERATKLLDALKAARDTANMSTTVDESRKIADSLFNYVFEGTIPPA